MAATMVESGSQILTQPPTNIDLQNYDEEQVRLMEERCILITPEDKAYGEDSKKTCELISGILILLTIIQVI